VRYLTPHRYVARYTSHHDAGRRTQQYACASVTPARSRVKARGENSRDRGARTSPDADPGRSCSRTRRAKRAVVANTAWCASKDCLTIASPASRGICLSRSADRTQSALGWLCRDCRHHSATEVQEPRWGPPPSGTVKRYHVGQISMGCVRSQ
jgi:hypothetical protein